MRHILPSSLLKRTRVDEFFEVESNALAEKPVLFESQSGQLVLRGESISGEVLVYRGWILTVAEYFSLEKAVLEQGARLFVTAEAYCRAQFIDGWVGVFKDVTPATAIFPYAVEDGVLTEEFVGGSKSFVVKGGSKSLKHDWENSMFAPRGSDVVRVVNSFRGQVSELEETCIAVREYENWLPGELRVFWVNAAACVQQHPNNAAPVSFGEDAGFHTFINKILKPLVKELGSPFVVTDVVMNRQREYRVVEVGDGQVSQSADFVVLHKHFLRYSGSEAEDQ